MEVFQHNQDINITVTLPYDNNTSTHIVPTSIVREIYNSEGVLLNSNSVTVPSTVTSTMDITIEKIYNSLNSPLKRDIRRIKTIFTNASYSLYSENRYIIETDGILQIMENSFINLDGALLVADSLNELDTWVNAEDKEKISSLITAFNKIANMKFRYQNSSGNTQSFYKDITSDSYYYIDDFRNVSLNDFNALPGPFKEALKAAQIYQANYVLEGNSAEERRRDGIISETVGEAKMFFNPRVPMRNPLCRPAMDLLSKYIYKKIRIGRI